MAAPGLSGNGAGAGAGTPQPVGHYRVALGLDLALEGYPGLEAYRHPGIHSHQHQHQQHHHQQQSPHHGNPPQTSQPVNAPETAADFRGRSATGPGHPASGNGSTAQQQQAGQFGILTPGPALHHHPGDPSLADGADAADKSHGHVPGKIVVDPPNLQAWREKLFNVDSRIILTQEEFETYFPHVDNVYSHRSTQRYKRKPFVSHYWDCRMKGRPPGTPKSDDPNKKKRKRTARERDLCDVKIKITEYFPGAQILPEADSVPTFAAAASVHHHAMFSAATAGPAPPPASGPITVGAGQKLWTIQRVNGNGGNGKGDGVAGPHKHSLAKSDEIKKNSVQRHVARQSKTRKTNDAPSQRKATGAALATTKKHAKDSDLKLYAACFCPFSQRVWIALEAKGLAYQYCEIDPYKKPAPTQLLEANPRGLVPAIRQGEWACSESAVILEYFEDLDSNVPLYPTDPRLKANCRQWIDHINARIVPTFYSLLQTQDPHIHTKHVDNLQSHITSLMLAADEHGPFFLGASLSLVDIHFAPFALRLSRVLRPLRGWADPIPGTRWHRWLEALETNSHVQATTSGNELYLNTTDLMIRQSTTP